MLWAPPPKIKISEWAEAHRILPKGASAKPGPWRSERYQVEILDCITQASVREVTFRASTQVGKSETLNNVIGYYIDADPKPIMMVQPTLQTAKEYSKKKIAPMIEITPVLKAKVREATARRAGNTMQLKEFEGGFVKLTGANSGPGLRSDQIAILLLDEIEAYPLDVGGQGGEGDPIEIAVRRTDTHDDAKIIKSSTPARPKGFCRIDAEYEASSQGIFHVPCPFCGHFQPLQWRTEDEQGRTLSYNLVYKKDAQGKLVPDSTFYQCVQCKELIDEKHKQKMIDRGHWVHKHPERIAHRGFHLNALYSPWRLNWHELAKEWIEAQDNPEKLKVFINLRLGESWNEGAEDFKVVSLHDRREAYIAEVPDGVGVLIAAADLQVNRIECDIWGFGAGEEAWLIDHSIFWGDPSASGDPETGETVWDKLNAHLLEEWKTFKGIPLRPAITFIDSGAHSDAVYDFVTPLQNTARRVFAVKGVDFLARPGLASETTAKAARVRLFNIATYAAKDRIFSRLKIGKPGPGYVHFGGLLTETDGGQLPPTDEWFAQLVSEKKISFRDKRTRSIKRVYVKEYLRNEALDMFVYANAGLFVLQQLDPARYRDLGAVAQALILGTPPPAPVVKQRRVRTAGTPLLREPPRYR